MVPRKPRIVTMPNTTSIQINTPSISLPTGLATLVRATEDWRQFASHSTPFPPAATTTTTTVRMMNNLAESTTHVSRPTTTTATATAPTIPFRPPRMEALCHRCGYDGVDILIRTCGCAFHARCIPWNLDSMGVTGNMSHHSIASSEASSSNNSNNNNSDKPTAGRRLIHSCPACKCTPCTLVLQPMKFDELDEARKHNLLVRGNKKKRASSYESSGKKRRIDTTNTTAHDPTDDEFDMSMIVSDINIATKPLSSRGNAKTSGLLQTSTSNNQADGDCRVGRWSEEETKFCNKLIAHFMAGQFPLLDGTKLNEFLANVLKLKQSRLTKKMKNAALAAKHFSRTTGSIPTVQECVDFSATEQDFLKKLTNPAEAADLKFHMQLFWRESFTTYCTKIHQPLDAREWLTSVEEMERRASYMKDAARMAKRKLYMGYALDLDNLNPDMGIFIDSDPLTRQNHASSILENSIHSSDDELDDFVHMIAADSNSSTSNTFPINDPDILSKAAVTSRILGKSNIQSLFSDNCNAWHYSSPFLAKVLVMIHRLCLPFEYLEAWVPSESSGDLTAGCRLYFAGNAITESCVPPTSMGSSSTSSESPTIPLTPDERFNLLCFGDYSEKFSFQIGSGLPGRVYATGVPIWEQNISEADKTHYERCGAAKLFGIQTALGIPVPSPTVGRIILVLYSQHDRIRDNTMVFNLVEEVVKLLPSPRWKLYIDLGKDNSASHVRAERAQRSRVSMRKDASTQEEFANNAVTTSVRPTTTSTKSRKSHATSEIFKRAAEPAVSPPDHHLSRSYNTVNTNALPILNFDSDRPSINNVNLKDELISILGEHMPLDPSSEMAFCLPGFMSLRLLLLKSNKTAEEEDMIATILNSFSSFRSTRLGNGEIAVMLTRDFLYLKQVQSRVEQQNSVASVLHQWSNNHNQHSGASLLHQPLDGNNVPFSFPSVPPFSFSTGMAMPSDQHALPQSFDSVHSDSDQTNPTQHSFSSDIRFPSFR